MKLRSFILPIISISGLIFAINTVKEIAKRPPATPLVETPATSPFADRLAGAGLVEPSSEYIEVASPVSGVAVEVAVRPGAAVKKGDLLFRIDPRSLDAQLTVRTAQLEQAKAKLDQLRAAPRAEDIPPLEAEVKAQMAMLKDDEDKVARLEKMEKEGAADEQSLTSARYAVQMRTSQAEKAAADLALMRAGTWKPLIAIAEKDVLLAETELNATKIELERLSVRAPIDATVLQVNVRAGEYVGAQGEKDPPMILGATETLHIRVDLDENDAPRFRSGAAGVAFVRGAQKKEDEITLEFVRSEPYVIPKKSLTGSSLERVDTRVLQVIYRITKKPGKLTLFCGQQVDAYIDVEREAAPAASQPK